MGGGSRRTQFIINSPNLPLPTPNQECSGEPIYSEILQPSQMLRPNNRLEPLNRADFLPIIPSFSSQESSANSPAMLGTRAARFDLVKVEKLLIKKPGKQIFKLSIKCFV